MISLTPLARRLLFVLAFLLVVLLGCLSERAEAQHILSCPGNRVIVGCPDCLFKSGFQ